MASESEIRLGTSAFTAAGWEGAFYPAGMKPADLSELLTPRNSMPWNCDNTFYRTPAISTVKGWYAEDSSGIYVCGKSSADHYARGKPWWTATCDFRDFLKTMDYLGEKLGPLLLQFGYFNKNAFAGVNEFLARLVPFLKKIPKGYRFAVEIRNKNWLVPAFIEALRERQIALALVDHVWMPRPKQLFDRFSPITADFAYVRWLGDRKGIEEKTKTWDKIIENRTADLGEWVEVLKKVHGRKIQISFCQQPLCSTAPAPSKSFES